MNFVPLLDKADIDPADLKAMEGPEKAFGRMLHTWEAIANRPGLFAQYFPYLRAVTGPGVLDPRIKEITAVEVAILNHCRYTASHRSFSALGKGVTEDDLASLAAHDAAAFTETEKLALEFTRAVTVDIPTVDRAESETGLAEDLLDRMRKAFSPEELIELLMSVSFWNGLARFHRVQNFDLDLPAAPPAVEAVL